MTEALRARAVKARAWLLDEALPVWAAHGVNPKGGFHDRLTADYRPLDPDHMRLRVQARQVYVFAEAGRLGWTGPWRALAEHGLNFLLHRGLREDGLFAAEFDGDGAVVEEGPELYDQAFALFGLAHGYRALGDPRALSAGASLCEALQAFADPAGGVREPRREVRGSNANMHLFEALLAWTESHDHPRWRLMSDQLAELCANRLTDGAGALREHFDASWYPAPGELGQLTEPGHHFEWAWLLRQSGRSWAGLAGELCDRAEGLGVDTARGVAVNAIGADGAMIDARARLWPQTERLRALLRRHQDGDEASAGRAAQAFDALFAYIDPAPSGLWYDVMEEDGTVGAEPAPASSFYHVMGALTELIRGYARW